MKKNIKACVEQPQYGEPVRLLGPAAPEVLRASGLSADPVHGGTALWRFSERTTVRFPLTGSRFADLRFLTFSVWAVSGAGGTFSLCFETGEAPGVGYTCLLPITHNGWNDYRIELPFLATVGDPMGWDHVVAAVLDCAVNGQTNRPETILSVGPFSGWQGIAPPLYGKRPELKGAAVFAENGAFAVVDRRRVPIAPDSDLSVCPFPREGQLWIPLAPVAAVLGRRAVVDNKAATLDFTYRRKFFSFGPDPVYTEDGEPKKLPFTPHVVAGTLFFPTDFVRDFFRWRQTFTDANGLLILSNRRQIFDRELEGPFLWNLRAELTFARRSGREILDDLRRNAPNASRGRLILRHEDWMRMRKVCREDAFMAERFKVFKATCDAKSTVFAEAPVLSEPAPGVAERAEQYRLASERILAFAALFRLTGEKIYAGRVGAEATALAALPSWNADTDLAGAETVALGVALGYDWCHPAWDEACKMKVERALLRYAVRPGLDACRAGSAVWREGTAKAATVHAGLLASALVLADEYPETTVRVLDRAPSHIAKCLSAYAPDGGFAAGVGEWGTATGALVAILSMLESACGTTYGLDALPGFRQTALFGSLATVAGRTWRPDHFSDTAFLPWFSRRYGDPAPAAIRREQLLSGEQAFGVRDLLFYADVYQKTTDIARHPTDAVFRKAGLAVLQSERPEGFRLLLHGGSNAVDGIRDAGTFLLASEGEVFFAGANTVTAGDPQPGGANAALLEVRGAPDRAYAVVDLTETLPGPLPGKRGAMLRDGRTVAVVQDEWNPPGETRFEWSAETTANVAILRTRYAILEQNGKRLLCRFSGASGRWETEPTPTGTRLFVRFSAHARVRFAVSFRAFREGDNVREPFYRPCPIATWRQ